MKAIYRILLAVIALPFLLSCTDNDFSILTDRERTIEVNGKKYPEGLVSFEGYWSDKAGHGELTVSVDQDDKYKGSYETNYYVFHFNNKECPKEGDNLAQMNLKLDVNGWTHSCSGHRPNYVSGDLIVKSTYNKKRGFIKIQLRNLKMSVKSEGKTEEYVFNGTVDVPFDYFGDID